MPTSQYTSHDSGSQKSETIATATRVRGSILLGIKDWLQEYSDRNAYKAVLERLSPPCREQFENARMLTVSMGDGRLYREALEAMAIVIGHGDPEPVYATAGVVAMRDLGTVMRLVMRIASPAFVAARFPTVWDHYFSAGRWENAEISPGKLVGKLTGATDLGRPRDWGTMGWTRAALAHAGAKNLRAVMEPEGAPGSGLTVFRYTWDT